MNLLFTFGTDGRDVIVGGEGNGQLDGNRFEVGVVLEEFFGVCLCFWACQVM